MISLLDTNVLVRFLIGSDEKKYKGAFSFFQSIERGEIQVELKLIVLFQTIFVLKSFYKVPKTQIVIGLKGILQLKGVKIKDNRIVQRMLELWDSNNIEIVDAYLIGCLENDSQNILYSYDTDFDKFNINRIEP